MDPLWFPSNHGVNCRNDWASRADKVLSLIPGHQTNIKLLAIAVRFLPFSNCLVWFSALEVSNKCKLRLRLRLLVGL